MQKADTGPSCCGRQQLQRHTLVTGGTLKAGAATPSARPRRTRCAAAPRSTWRASASGRLAANSGTVSLVGTAPGTTLTVNGAYVGNNGVLRLGTFLGDARA